MIVRATRDGLVLAEAEEFGALKVVTDGSAEARDELGRLCVPDGDGHVRIAGDRLVALAEREGARDGAWHGKLDAMLATARTYGWVDDAGGVRMHVEEGAAAER
ncbi:hypothetical protein RDV89_03905 [Nocardioides zeae]|uniref:Uncharacterized protein n=1 Tax=Nocardioides imazamoxiresistens TaxID=3231893 RepID=A0ABU3PSJ0_9ACTN|nr:hypothetical protein [Nocardioides zeae]MDT9592195.1 hypothetical protein [Nocardioides zeae]